VKLVLILPTPIPILMAGEYIAIKYGLACSKVVSNIPHVIFVVHLVHHTTFVKASNFSESNLHGTVVVKIKNPI